MKLRMTKRAHPRPISIRWSLFTNFLILVILISGSLLIYSLAGATRAIHSLSASLFEEVSQAAEYELEKFFAPISKSIEIVRDLGRRGAFSPDNPRSANTILIPVLLAIPQMASVNTGDAKGNAFLLVRRKDGWLSVFMKGGASTAEWQQVDERGRVLKEWTQEINFDPRTRPWYEQVEGRSDSVIHWTAPYGFVPTGDPGITAAVLVESPQGPYVLAFDLLLEEVTDFAQRIAVPGGGKLFVLTNDGRMLVPPFEPGRESPDFLLKHPEELSVPLITESVRRWREQPTAEPFQFALDDETWWWCGFERYHLGPEQSLWIAVLIPAQSLVGADQRDRLALLLVTLLALAVATLMAFYLSRSYGKPLQALVEHSSRLQTLKTDVEVEVKSRLSEVRHLADAQEKMRRALDSFARYVPVEVVRELLDRGEAAQIGGRNAEVTVLFTDITGFTAIAESMSAADLAAHMSSYFDAVVGILNRHGATVDKFIGDSIMAFWGAPKLLSNHSRCAIEAVIEIREWLGKANHKWRAQGLPPLPTRFGLATGEVTVGNVGAAHRLSYTIFGDAVNLAQRLEALNSKLKTSVLVDESVREAAGDGFAWRDVEKVEIKGKSVSVRIFELLGREVGAKRT
jgi:adenylate cyclase